MAMNFNADEIFEMALQMERSAADFYGRAAEKVDNPEVRQVLAELSSWEREHEQMFEQLRGQFKEKMAAGGYDPDEQVEAYLQAMARDVFASTKKGCDELEQAECAADVLTTAIRAEQQAILFYTGIHRMVPEELGRDKIEAVIDEEMRHMTVLSQWLGRII